MAGQPRGLMDYIPDYLRNSWDGLARGAQAVREATDPFQYAAPAAQMAAGMLPGAGLVQGSMDFQNGRQALGDGRYGDAAMDYGLGLINAGTDMIPAMAAVPPIRRGLPMDGASRMARAQEQGYSPEPLYRGEASGKLPDEYGIRPNYFSRDEEYSRGFSMRGGGPEPREFRLQIPEATTYPTYAPLSAQKYMMALDAINPHAPDIAASLLDDIAPGRSMEWFREYVRRYPDQMAAESGSLLWAPLERVLGTDAAAMAFGKAGFENIDTGRDIVNLTGKGIRHKDAAFDPKKAASRNIFYGLGALGAAGLGASAFEGLMSYDGSL